ncbi:MAG: hypothetical protein HY473_01700 [Candidatus Sungbacteria bacterium]|uniref:Uncharacterized protein n=1 Tax=Candidatus Sungiibacteriota bacterium TaxID=2750080 RepID=A0A932YYU5_9BACT|nr:hypothetical protein [Candidatus Sungbacteria bacterium]
MKTRELERRASWELIAVYDELLLRTRDPELFATIRRRRQATAAILNRREGNGGASGSVTARSLASA